MSLEEIKQRLKKEFANDKNLLLWSERGRDYAFIARDKILKAAAILRDEFAFDLLMDLFCVDYLTYSTPLPDGDRYEIITHLYSSKTNERLFVKTYYSEDDPSAESLTGLYPAANWFEREAFDMYGIVFKNHPDLRRILMYDGFEGHPLRKDYDIKKRQPLATLIKKERSVFEDERRGAKFE